MGREIDWHIVDDEFNAHAVETLKATDVLIMGRRTYELMGGYWPTARDDEDPDVQNSRLATGSAADEVARLMRVPGDGLFWVGGSDLAVSFLEQGLMDELRIIFTPILLGKGKTVFGAIKKRYPLKLLSTKSFPSDEPAMR